MRNWSKNQITLVLIRHGATKSNKEHRYLGKTEESLSDEGVNELLEYDKLQYYPPVDYLFTSPMRRCIQTAEILYPDLSIIPIEEWTEMDFGVFEGKNYKELQGDVLYQAWIDSGGTLPFPEGESREEFILRCEMGFRRMIKELMQINNMEESITLGLIVHGGTIMSLLSKYCGGDYFEYQVANGKGYVCTLESWEDVPKITKLRKI